ncbi:WXG100 family type VII secretion target [Nocardioides yefusunii]|uniref:ESAT-6-like protein n=1 Tax=Nocardioides yefusunii TaxID=2500546 RepID=A0ABW1QZT2_9ACTN|nr:WXG100 family type VII secretion target [Nocardioides yefusunii]
MSDASRSANQVSATAGALATATQHVESARADVTSLCTTLGSQIEGIGSRWAGEGARAFHQVHQTWQQKQNRLVSALDDFAESLTQTDRDNLATDAARAEVSQRLLARLG